ncbi:MAG: cysteine hydrolase [Acidobacteriia bacterium]|nr:cysteine hydrolase [Terriglobia bacterium]
MRTVFFDVDTQIDFLFPAGALYVPGAERIIPNLARLNQFAARNRIPLISTMDAHAENDPEFRTWPAHCVAGTVGQSKPQSLLVQQHIVEKQALDCFSNPHLPALLDSLHAERYVVYGVVTEICVLHAVTGLLKTGARVELVCDAVMHLDEAAAERMMSGLNLTTTGEVCRA